MADSPEEILNPGISASREMDFPHAPRGWTRSGAQARIDEEGLEVSDDLWQAVRALQEYFDKHAVINTRELHDALGEKFHSRGGTRFLYIVFPGGPIAQGCRIAGLRSPAGAIDKGFGSVQ